jgi:hypothetical protein
MNLVQPNQVKKPVTLPYVQPGQNLGLAAPSVPVNGATGTSAVPAIDPTKITSVNAAPVAQVGANQQVLETAQQKAIQGFASPVMDTTSQKTLELLNQPAPDLQKQKIAAMEKFNLDQAKSLQALTQQYADVSNLGPSLEKMVSVQMNTPVLRSQLESEQDAAIRKEELSRQLSLLAEGRSTAESERNRFATDIGALTSVRGAAEGEATRNVQQAESAIDRGLQIATSNQNATLQGYLTELKGKQDKDMLLTSQDFEGTQNELQRELDKALAEGNWQNAFNIQQMQQTFETQRQESQQKFASAERVATQGWQTGERISEQDYKTASQVLDQKHALAMQNNDIVSQREIEDNRNKLNLAMQTAGFTHEEKITRLNDELATARADGDVGRQKSILEFTHRQNLEEIAKTQGFQAAQNQADRDLQTALSSGDHLAAQALQTQRLEMEVSENAKNRVLEEASLALQTRGVNMQEIEQQYNQLADQEERGIIEAGASTKYLQDQLKNNGVTGVELKSINAEDQAKKVIDAQYNSLMYQFAKTHPEMQDTTTDSGLSDEGLTAFSKFFNESTYGEGKNKIEDITNSLTGTVTDETEKQKIFDNATTWEMEQHVDGKGFWNPDMGVIDNPPSVGSIIKFSTRSYPFGDPNAPYQVLTDIAENTDGENYQYFTAKNMFTGEIVTISAVNY